MNNNYGTGSFVGRKAVYKQNKYPNLTDTYVGTSASMAYSASFYLSKGWDVEVDYGNPYTLTATLDAEVSGDGVTPITTTGSYVTVNWSLHYNTTDKELLHVSTNVISWINQIDTKDKVTLEGFISNPPSGSINWSSSFATSTTSSINNAQVLWAMVSNGFKTVPIAQQVLRMTMVVPSGYNMTTFNNNLNRIYAKASVQSEIGVPSNWYNIMLQQSDPTSLVADGGQSIPLHYGWLKQPPTQDQNGTTITIQQEWNYGLYFQNVFGTVL